VQTAVAAAVARAYGPLTSSFAHDPSLIGGLRIRVGSHLYDGTILGRLAALEALM
jgi:F0F1-type ATP synthase delta subunit